MLSPVAQQYQDLIIPVVRDWNPKSLLGKSIFKALPYLPPDLQHELFDKIVSAGILESKLSIRVFRHYGLIEDYGVVSHKVVTNNGVGYIVDAFQNLTELENMKFHGLGTGSTAEAAADAALVTELTTQYTGDVRATGTTTESAANIYRTVATNTMDQTPGAALREHGIFSAASAGVLLDRSVYAAITLSSGDGLESTYDLTITAGG